MNIKLASERSGVSSRNIRYYEQAGLLHPDRDPENDYRIYTEEDIRTLKLIRTLRMLDMPLEEIRDVLAGSLPLPEAAARQQERLQARARELDSAIRFCGELRQRSVTAAALDVDACLTRIAADNSKGWFSGWADDYRAMARAQQRRHFTFTPDGPVTTPAEFTDALFAFAKEQKLELVVTQEGMQPHFTIDGVEYRAVRAYYPVRGIPTARISCTLCDPDFAEDGLPPARRKLLELLHYSMPALCLVAVGLLFLIPRGLLTTWWGIALLIAFAAAGVSSSWYNRRFFYNDKDNQPFHGKRR